MKLGLYQHYKGPFYQVIGVGRHSETLEEFVIYQMLHENYGLWVRPLEMFQGNVEINGQSVRRFTFVRTLFENAQIE